MLGYRVLVFLILTADWIWLGPFPAWALLLPIFIVQAKWGFRRIDSRVFIVTIILFLYKVLVLSIRDWDFIRCIYLLLELTLFNLAYQIGLIISDSVLVRIGLLAFGIHLVFAIGQLLGIDFFWTIHDTLISGSEIYTLDERYYTNFYSMFQSVKGFSPYIHSFTVRMIEMGAIFLLIKHRSLKIITWAIWFMLVYLNDSRALIYTIPLFFLYVRAKRIPSVVFLFVSLFALVYLSTYIYQIELNPSDLARLGSLIDGVNLFTSNPFIGVSTQGLELGIHNYYLREFAVFGLFGGVFSLALVIVCWNYLQHQPAGKWLLFFLFIYSQFHTLGLGDNNLVSLFLVFILIGKTHERKVGNS